MAVENIDLSQEIESWKSAVYGKDVRSANVAAFEKIQGTVNDTVQNVNQAAEDSASASHNAQAAVDSIQTAITTATEKAAAAATSATQQPVPRPPRPALRLRRHSQKQMRLPVLPRPGR